MTRATHLQHPTLRFTNPYYGTSTEGVAHTRCHTPVGGLRMRQLLLGGASPGTAQSTSSMLGPPGAPPASPPGMPPGIPPGIPPMPPPCEYIDCMIGEQMPSTSFCLCSNSSFSASWLDSSHERASSMAFSALDLSSSEILSLSLSSPRVFFIE